MNFRPLKANEIELRVGTVQKDGATLLLYKDARCDMRVLDEAVGPENWQKRYYEVKNNLYCSVGIRENDKEFIWKDDCGTESNTEKEKGEASDAFKRACVNWGIGRELYTAPRVKIRCETKPRDGSRGFELSNRFEFWGAEVSKIEYQDKKIVHLEIEKDGKRIYKYHDGNAEPNADDQISAEMAEAVKKALMETGSDVEVFLKMFKVASVEALSMSQIEAVNKALDKKRKKTELSSVNIKDLQSKEPVDLGLGGM